MLDEITRENNKFFPNWNLISFNVLTLKHQFESYHFQSENFVFEIFEMQIKSKLYLFAINSQIEDFEPETVSGFTMKTITQ